MKSEMTTCGHVVRTPLAMLCLGMAMAVGWVDYMTGIDVSVTAMYLVPIAIAAWFGRRNTGLLVATFCSLIWLAADAMGRRGNGHPFVPVWNAAMLAFEFVTFAFLIRSLKRKNEQLETTVAIRTRSLTTEIADRVEAERKLLQSNAKLGRAHQKLQQSLNELGQTQAQLVEAARLELVGHLAAGVAHEVKNPLMTLSLGADYFANRNNGSADEDLLVRDMKEAVRRASGIINQLLDIAKPRSPKWELEDLNELITTALSLVRPQFDSKHVTVVRQLQAALPRVLLDRGQINQVLVNLFINASQAMVGGGTITVRTLGPTGSSVDMPNGVVVQIDDTGLGIAPENMNRIFDPFFTTKPAGVGTGLGLVTSKTIMGVHQGSVSLANRLEGGVRATLRFNLELEEGDRCLRSESSSSMTSPASPETSN